MLSTTPERTATLGILRVLTIILRNRWPSQGNFPKTTTLSISEWNNPFAILNIQPLQCWFPRCYPRNAQRNGSDNPSSKRFIPVTVRLIRELRNRFKPFSMRLFNPAERGVALLGQLVAPHQAFLTIPYTPQYSSNMTTILSDVG